MNGYDVKSLIKSAFEVKTLAYTPFSHFNVGAALLCADGRIFKGCNIENSSFSPTLCAERAAFASAISAGERSFKAIAIAGDGNDSYIVPCGVCRQFMYEFCDDDFDVILTKGPDDCIIKKLPELLPMGFRLGR